MDEKVIGREAEACGFPGEGGGGHGRSRNERTNSRSSGSLPFFALVVLVVVDVVALIIVCGGVLDTACKRVFPPLSLQAAVVSEEGLEADQWSTGNGPCEDGSHTLGEKEGI